MEVKPGFQSNIFLWQTSNNSVAMMNIDNLDNQAAIDRFWSDESQPSYKIDPITLVVNIKPEKVLGLAEVNLSSYVLRTYDIEKRKMKEFEFKMHHKELGLPETGFSVVSIDKSQRTNQFFAAVLLKTCESKVMMIKISKEGLSLATSCTISAQGFSSIHRISSYQISKHDYILASGTNSLVLLKSKDKSITQVHVFESICKGEIVDSCILRNKFFSVSPGNQFVIEATACNKLDDADMDIIQRHYSEGRKEQIEYDRYVIGKLEVANSKFNRIDINKKGDVLYVTGKGILAITGIHSSKPSPSDHFYESNLR